MTGRQHDLELPKDFANDGPAAQDWQAWNDPVSRFVARLPVWVIIAGVVAAAMLPAAVVLIIRYAMAGQ